MAWTFGRRSCTSSTDSLGNAALTDMLFGKLATLRGLSSRIEGAWHRLPSEALFGEAQLRTINHPQVISEGWETCFGAACAGIEAPKPGDPEFSQFKAINREVFDTFAVHGQLRIDYETRVTFARPLDGTGV